MKVREYKDSDYEQLVRWQEARQETMFDKALLSDIGFIVDDYAAGFLYTTNSKVCYIEGLLANPLKDRNRALDAVIKKLTSKAKELGFTTIVGITSLPAVSIRAEKHNFISSDKHYLLMKHV